MLEEKNAEYYDNFYKDKPDLSRYDEIHKEIGNMVGKSSVLDIGCGSSEIAKYIPDYKGFDFSKEAIDIAKEKGLNVWVGSAYDKENFKKADCYVSTELLEYTDDLKVIQNIPKDYRLIFTVPSFSDPAHLRTYTEDIIRIRFRDLLEIKEIKKYNFHSKWELGGTNTLSNIYLVDSIKK